MKKKPFIHAGLRGVSLKENLCTYNVEKGGKSMVFLLVLIFVALLFTMGGIFYTASILEEVLEEIRIRKAVTNK